MHRFLYYFIWTIVIGLISYVGMKLQLKIEYHAVREFNYTPLAIYAVIFPLVVGVLLRLPKLIVEIKEQRKWHFDGVKFLAIALPTLSIITLFILHHSGARTTINFFFTGGSTFVIIAGIVLGYTFVDCLKE